jgi:hypothetical protein
VIAPPLMGPIRANCTRIRVKAEVAATCIRWLPQCPKTNTLDILPYTPANANRCIGCQLLKCDRHLHKWK